MSCINELIYNVKIRSFTKLYKGLRKSDWDLDVFDKHDIDLTKVQFVRDIIVVNND